MVTRKSQIAFCAVCCLLAAGCDPTRATSQVVRLRVIDSASREPLEGVEVSLKYDELTAEPLPPKHWDMTVEEWVEYQRDEWDRSPWFVGSTDSGGQAEIDFRYSGIDRTRGSKPPPSSDWATGELYLVGVKRGQLPEEELSLVP